MRPQSAESLNRQQPQLAHLMLARNPNEVVAEAIVAGQYGGYLQAIPDLRVFLGFKRGEYLPRGHDPADGERDAEFGVPRGGGAATPTHPKAATRTHHLAQQSEQAREPLSRRQFTGSRISPELSRIGAFRRLPAVVGLSACEARR